MRATRLLCVSWLLLLLEAPSAAAPSIGGVSGALVHRGSITITGSGFGAKSPATPLWWDDGEGAPLGGMVEKTGQLPWVTSTLVGTEKHYSDAQPRAVTQNGGVSNIRYRAQGHRGVAAPHARSAVFITGCHDDEGECLGGEVGQDVGLTVGDASRHPVWYVTYYLRLDPAWPTDGTTHNYKFFNWEMGAPRAAMYSSPFCYVNTNGCSCGSGSQGRANPGCDLPYWGGISVVQILDPATCPSIASPTCGAPWVTHDTLKPNPRRGWTREEHWLDYAGELYRFSVENHLFLDNSLAPGCRFNKTTYPNAPSGATIGGFWKQNMCGNLQDDLNDDACRYFDDVYVDTTFARVVLADSSSYAAATILEPQIPTAWVQGPTTGSITATVNLGRLPGTGTAYLFVFDGSNQRNSTGFAVTLGGAPGPDLGTRDLFSVPIDQSSGDGRGERRLAASDRPGAGLEGRAREGLEGRAREGGGPGLDRPPPSSDRASGDQGCGCAAVGGPRSPASLLVLIGLLGLKRWWRALDRSADNVDAEAIMADALARS